MKLRNFVKNVGGAIASGIVMFLVVIVIFCGLFGTIAYQLATLQTNESVIAIPGGVVILGVVGLMGIIMVLMYAIRKAGLM